MCAEPQPSHSHSHWNTDYETWSGMLIPMIFRANRDQILHESGLTMNGVDVQETIQ